MSIAPDGRDERRTRIDRMIDEFREAQSRRLAKAAVNGDDQAVKSQRDAHGQAAVAGSTTTPTSHEHD